MPIFPCQHAVAWGNAWHGWGRLLIVQGPDPAGIRLEVLTRLVEGREGWTSTPEGWRLGPYELVPTAHPGLSYEVWRGPRCIAAIMVPRDAVAVTECLCEAAGRIAPPPQRLFENLSIPLPPTSE